MTVGQIITSVEAFCESRITKLALEPWVNLEVQKLVHRERFFWRKKQFAFNTTATVKTYDMTSYPSAGGFAADYEQMINLYYIPGGGAKPVPLKYMDNEDDVQNYLASTATGPPTGYTMNPGNPLKLMIVPIPDAAYSISGLYWATYVAPSPEDSSEDTTVIPLVPTQFHYLVLLGTMKRAFLYLFGQADPRYTTIKEELEGPDGKSGELKKLLDFTAPSQESEAIRPPWVGPPYSEKEPIEVGHKSSER